MLSFVYLHVNIRLNETSITICIISVITDQWVSEMIWGIIVHSASRFDLTSCITVSVTQYKFKRLGTNIYVFISFIQKSIVLIRNNEYDKDIYDDWVRLLCHNWNFLVVYNGNIFTYSYV